MKLRNMIVAATAASATYLAITHREKLIKEGQETAQLLADVEASKTNIQEQLAIIKSFQAPLQAMAKDLTYKTRVYQQSIAGNIQAIQNIQAKYSHKHHTSHE